MLGWFHRLRLDKDRSLEANLVLVFYNEVEKTAELVGKEIPLDPDTLPSGGFNIGGPNFHLDRKFSVNVVNQSTEQQSNSNWVSNSDAQLASQGSSSAKLWKILFFAFLALALISLVVGRRSPI